MKALDLSGSNLNAITAFFFYEDILHKEHKCILGLRNSNCYKATLHNIILNKIIELEEI